jgi:predicted XRE-type DNA-binding protein
MARTRKQTRMERSSGNVFADLKLPDAAELNTKVRLGVEINRVLASRRLTQHDAARLLRINQPKVSALRHYNLDGFSVERLMNFLTALGHDVEIRVKARRSARAPGRIVVAAPGHAPRQ